MDKFVVTNKSCSSQTIGAAGATHFIFIRSKVRGHSAR